MNNQDPAVTGVDTPIFDALAQQAPVDPLEDIALSDAVPADSEPELAPDAAARDAAKREEVAEGDQALSDANFRFITRGTTEVERAAVIAVLTKVRAEETERVKRVERREHQPWARSQRVPEGIGDLLAEG
jgi:hypothetical protein